MMLRVVMKSGHLPTAVTHGVSRITARSSGIYLVAQHSKMPGKIPDKWMLLFQDNDARATNKEVSKCSISNIMDLQADDA